MSSSESVRGSERLGHRLAVLVAGVLVMGTGSSCHEAPPSSSPAALTRAPALLAAVGDVADCAHQHGEPARATARLLAGYAGPVIVAGDLAYENGTPEEFSGCYDKLWGPLKDRTHPAPGNHEYGIYLEPTPRNDAVPYFEYFGAAAGPVGKGFYSFDRGAWHVVSLNSMAGVKRVAAPSMDEQVRWLEQDLRRTDKACILAFWHHPLWSSGGHGQDRRDPGRKIGPLWDVLIAHGADVVINGHDHHYERFAPQSATGALDRAHGIREFIVGTGGAEMRALETAMPNSEVRLSNDATDHGVLFLRLHPAGYEWTFTRIDGTTGDASTAPEPCHPKGR